VSGSPDPQRAATPDAGRSGTTDAKRMTIRPATLEDQAAITDLIHQVHLNPRDLDWRRFVVAVADDHVVGVAQIRIHRRGTRELASVAVASSLRGSGVGSRLVETLIAGAPGTLYLMTRRETEGYFARFGFQTVEAASTPADFRRQFRIGQIATAVFSIPARQRIRIVPMRREAAAAG
jgi:N-acetylglutamate synthase-like GNAT family acetyltransferase